MQLKFSILLLLVLVCVFLPKNVESLFGFGKKKKEQKEAQERAKNDVEVGMQELKKMASDPNELRDTMAMLQDPEVQAEVNAMMADPAFQEEMKVYAESAQFKEAMEKAQAVMEELQADPAKMARAQEQVAEMLQTEQTRAAQVGTN